MIRIQWQFSESEIALLKTKHKKNRLYFALQLKYYQFHHEFLGGLHQLSPKTICNVSKKLKLSPKVNPVSSRIQAIYRQSIREHFQFKAVEKQDEKRIRHFLMNTVFPKESLNIESLKERIYGFLEQEKIEFPSEGALERTIKSAQHQYEEALFARIASQLDSPSKGHLEGLLLMEDHTSCLAFMKRSPDGLSLKTILREAEKLAFFKQLALPSCLNEAPNKALQRYYRQICTSIPVRSRKCPKRIAMLCWLFFRSSKKEPLSIIWLNF